MTLHGSEGGQRTFGSLAGNRRAATPGFARGVVLSKFALSRKAAHGRSRASSSHLGSRLSPPRKRSEGETNTDCRSKVARVVVGDAGAMRNGDGQTAAHVRIRNSGVTVETLGEVMIRIE
jgi:hypothetical protein